MFGPMSMRFTTSFLMNRDMKERIKLLAQGIEERLIGIRRHLHAHPELSFEEKETSLYVQGILNELNVPFTTGWAGYGIVATLENGQGPTVALRADMDALPILEANQVEYVSKNIGVMHACGHDVHTSVLLGAIMVLDQMRDVWQGRIVCVFQPGEEKLPGGASLMIKEGLFERYKPKAMYGLHVHPPLNAGQVGVKSGLYMASADEIYITINGKGGHAAVPHEAVDPIYMASEIITSLQSVISRRAYPATPSVLTIGKIQSEGGATNIIPNRVFLEGTFRTMDEEWRAEAHQIIHNVVDGICRGHGGHADVDIKVGYPYLKNDESLTAISKEWMEEYLGKEHVVELPLRMSAEDFAYYTHHVPCCFYRLGTGNKELGITSSVHQNTFDVDEKSLVTGSGMMAWLVMNQLSY